MLVLEQEIYIDIVMTFLICPLRLCLTGGMEVFSKIKSSFHNPTFLLNFKSGVLRNSTLKSLNEHWSPDCEPQSNNNMRRRILHSVSTQVDVGLDEPNFVFQSYILYREGSIVFFDMKIYSCH